MSGIISDNQGRSTGLIKAAGGGKLLQIIQGEKTDTASWTGTIAQTDTGLTASITPSATSSKILIQWLLNIGYGGSKYQYAIHLDRDGTEISKADASTDRKLSHAQRGFDADHMITSMTDSMSGVFLDSPSSTSSLTYKLRHTHINDGATFYINRSHDDRQSTTYDSRNVSNLILIEIGA